MRALGTVDRVEGTVLQPCAAIVFWAKTGRHREGEREEVQEMVEPSLGSREHDFPHAFPCWPIADGHPLSLRPSSALGVRGQGTRTEFT